MVRADGDALVMHVGERPYVVTQAGTLDLSTHGLNLGAMTGMLQQLLPAEQQSSLEEFGAVEHTLPSLGDDRFTLVAARGGDDIWIEIRRRRPAAAGAVAAPPAPVQEQAPEPVQEMAAAPQMTAAPEPVPVEVIAEPEPIVEPIAEPEIAPVLEVAAAPEPIAQPESVSEPEMEPVFEVAAAPEAVAELELVSALEPNAEPQLVPDVEPRVEPVVVAEVEMPIAEMVAPTVELAEPVAELDHAALLDQLIPIDDPDVEEMPLELMAAIAEQQAAEASQPELVGSFTSSSGSSSSSGFPGSTDQFEIDAAVEHAELVAPESAEPVDPVYARFEPAESVAPIEPVEPAESAFARADSDELRRDSAVLSAEALAKAGASAQAEAASGREGEPAYARETGPYVVLPMTRTVRIEVPTRVMSQSRTSTVERLLQLAAARSASSLFLTSDSRPYIRVEGDIRQLEGEAMLSKAEIEAAVMEIVPQEVQDPVGRGEAIEWIAELPELGRIRCTSFRDHRGPGVVFNLIATRAATAEQLGLPREVQAFATEAEGLVLVAGPRGSGKSTLMSALVDLVNRQRTDYVIMLERQIRLVHDNRTALVSQREIRGSADDALAAARAALRENPDVLVVDDLSSAHMVPLLLEAAAGGLLVFVSITAPSTADAVARFLELAPPGTRTSVHAAMAETFRGAVSQVLLKKTAGGRVVAREIMLATAAVTRLIGDGHLTQLPLALESGRRHGMVPLTDVLLGLVQSGVVDVREAFRKTHDRDRLLSGLKREGVDTSVVERLA